MVFFLFWISIFECFLYRPLVGPKLVIILSVSLHLSLECWIIWILIEIIRLIIWLRWDFRRYLQSNLLTVTRNSSYFFTCSLQHLVKSTSRIVIATPSYIGICFGVRVMVFNASFNNISVILWQSNRHPPIVNSAPMYN